jgi:RNA-binding protein
MRRGRPPKKKRSPGPKGRITKKTGDVRSKPDKGKRDLATSEPEARAERPAPGPRADHEGAPAKAEHPLSGKAVRHLRSLGHHLDPVVQVGKDGITDAVVAATREALRAHELVKVRVGTEAPVDRKDAGEELASRSGAHLAQTLGRTLLLYKRHPHEPKIVLPR